MKSSSPDGEEPLQRLVGVIHFALRLLISSISRQWMIHHPHIMAGLAGIWRHLRAKEGLRWRSHWKPPEWRRRTSKRIDPWRVTIWL